MKRKIVDWTLIPQELLQNISEFLFNGTDYIRFRSVCKEWRCAVPRKHILPLLIVPGEESPDEFHLFRISDGESRGMIVPTVVSSKTCHGSSHGFLIMADPGTHDILLWNPLSGAIIHLSWFGYAYRLPLLRPSQSRNPPPPKMESMRRCTIYKAILSANPYTYAHSAVYLAAIFNPNLKRSKVAFQRLGSGHWVLFLQGDSFSDILFYKGHLYAIDGACNVYVCDIHDNDSVEVLAIMNGYSRPGGISRAYLVVMGRDLWAVLQYKIIDPQDERSVVGFTVVRLERDGVSMMPEEVEDIGDRALFVGLNECFSVCTNDFPQCRRNCIYYTNCPTPRPDDVNGNQDFGIFDLGNHTLERVPRCHFEYPLRWAPSTWFIPGPY